MMNQPKSFRSDFQFVLQKIESADDFEIRQIMDAVKRRYQLRFPDWEVLYISCPKNDPAAQQHTLEMLCEHFERSP